MITISLCMIVKNEEEVLSRILEPMSRIADEIIIVDTGSTDRTKELASQFTPNVYDFPWQQDFAAARNYACSKASKDYWMWLDADDMIAPGWQKELLNLKNNLEPDIDIVMMKYVTDFDENGRPAFYYYRERLIKNDRSHFWKGKVHEAVTPEGNVLYSPIEIEHRKAVCKDSDRNLKIYEMMIQNGEKLEPRHQYYYARELYYHGRFNEAVQTFLNFLKEPDAWLENQIDACLMLSRCYEKMGKRQESLKALFNSFLYDLPRAEISCEIGRLLMEKQAYRQAVYWFLQALAAGEPETSGAFIQKDYYDYIPNLQLCVCYDRLGEREKALEYHRRSMEAKPDSEAVKYNQIYFQKMSEG